MTESVWITLILAIAAVIIVGLILFFLQKRLSNLRVKTENFEAGLDADKAGTTKLENLKQHGINQEMLLEKEHLEAKNLGQTGINQKITISSQIKE